MKTIEIKNIDYRTIQILEAKARKKGITLAEEIRSLLEKAAKSSDEEENWPEGHWEQFFGMCKDAPLLVPDDPVPNDVPDLVWYGPN